MHKFVTAALLVLLHKSAYCGPHDWNAMYCKGVIDARNQVVESLVEAIATQPTEEDRRAIERFILKHREVKARLARYLQTISAPDLAYIQELGVQDVDEDAARRLRCDREHRDCIASEATNRLSTCDNLWWLP